MTIINIYQFGFIPAISVISSISISHHVHIMYNLTLGMGGGGGHFHMLGVQGCAARQGVIFVDQSSQGILLPIFLVCVLSGMLFNLIVSCIPPGYTISHFLIVFFFLSGSGSGSGSLGGTTCQSWYLFSMLAWVRWVYLIANYHCTLT